MAIETLLKHEYSHLNSRYGESEIQLYNDNTYAVKMMIFVFAEHSNTTAGSRSGIITIFPTFCWPNISYCCSESHVYMRLVYDCSKGGEVLPLVFGDTWGTNGQVVDFLTNPIIYWGACVLATVSTVWKIIEHESYFQLELALWQGKKFCIKYIWRRCVFEIYFTIKTLLKTLKTCRVKWLLKWTKA